MATASLLRPTRKADAKQLQDLVAEAEGFKESAEESAGVATAQAGIATSRAAEAAVERALAQTAAGNSLTNSQSAAAAAASIQDTAARVGAMLKARGITNIKAIAFKRAEGWEKTGNQSYKTEARPAGRFLGDYANATAAWAANYQGVATVTGDYYWQTSGTIGLFECTTSNASTQRYRAGSDHMPLEAAIVACTISSVSYVIIFDLTDPLLPAWMIFKGANTGNSVTPIGSSTATIGRVVYLAGRLYMPSSGSWSGLYVIDFKTEVFYRYREDSQSVVLGRGLSRRNTLFSYLGNGALPRISKSIINAVAGTDDGYIAAATSGGVSVIKPDGTVVKSASTDAFKSVSILNGRMHAINDTASPEQLVDFGPIESLGASFTAVNTWTNATIPSLSAATLTALGQGDNSLLIPSGLAVDQLWPNPAVMADSLISRRGTTYATPPMKKPEVMLICSTVEGAVSGAELVDQDFSNWTDASIGTGTAVANAGALDISGTDGSNRGISYYPITCTIGRTYKLSVECTAYTSGGIVYGIDDDDNYQSLISFTTLSATGESSLTFVANAATMYVFVNSGGSGGVGTIDNVSVLEVIADHSGKSQHATINGTLTATAEVAGGVGGLSGFSAANYLECPYDADLDVGTGDFCYSFAFKSAGNSADETLICRADPSHAGATTEVALLAAGTLAIKVSGSTTSVSASAYDDGLVHTGLIYRRSGVMFLEVDGQVVDSDADTTNLTNATAVLNIGVRSDATLPATTSSIWFAGASAVAPTAEEAALMHLHMRNLIEGKAALDEIPSALAYDPIRKAVEMVGATYRQTMQDGAITSSVAHGQGTTPAVAVGSRSEIAVGGTTGLSISVPERNLRQYNARLTKERFPVKYAGNATASRVLFPDPATAVEMAVTLDAKPVRVSNAGVVQTEGASDDYTVKDYGLGRYVVQFAVAPADGNDVLIEFEREVWK